MKKVKGYKGSGYDGHNLKPDSGDANVQMSRLNEGGDMKWKGKRKGMNPTKAKHSMGY
jgi:hypothetical protein